LSRLKYSKLFSLRKKTLKCSVELPFNGRNRFKENKTYGLEFIRITKKNVNNYQP